mmetsp:Transcript_78425/g.229945  ORF Transcript_78425/g.229945 Transcript_78425/m.229945 type:complete len:386 (+) Transcript_78425:63-1220(+)
MQGNCCKFSSKPTHRSRRSICCDNMALRSVAAVPVDPPTGFAVRAACPQGVATCWVLAADGMNATAGALTTFLGKSEVAAAWKSELSPAMEADSLGWLPPIGDATPVAMEATAGGMGCAAGSGGADVKSAKSSKPPSWPPAATGAACPVCMPGCPFMPSRLGDWAGSGAGAEVKEVKSHQSSPAAAPSVAPAAAIEGTVCALDSEAGPGAPSRPSKSSRPRFVAAGAAGGGLLVEPVAATFPGEANDRRSFDAPTAAAAARAAGADLRLGSGASDEVSGAKAKRRSKPSLPFWPSAPGDAACSRFGSDRCARGNCFWGDSFCLASAVSDGMTRSESFPLLAKSTWMRWILSRTACGIISIKLSWEVLAKFRSTSASWGELGLSLG